MVEGAELEAVVGAADQVAPAPGVTVITAAVTGAVTVTLALSAGILRSAAPATIEVTTRTSLAWWGTGRWIAGDTKARAKSDEKQCYQE